MKNFMLALCVMLSFGVAGSSYAEKNKAINCGTWPPTNDIKCADKGGTISCIEGSSSPLCCKTTNGKKVCTNNPDLLDRLAATQGTANPGATAGVNANPGNAKPSSNNLQKNANTFGKNAPAVK
jgi:hypothetical protein